MARTAVILTTYNRPCLVRDAIASVLDQTDPDWRLILLDDGCDNDSRTAIHEALLRPAWQYVCELAGGVATSITGSYQLTWWRGPQRTMAERKATISYSRTINIALNYLLADERYIGFLCDDDYFYPEAIQARADFLDVHPEVHVAYGRSRSVQHDARGFNAWQQMAAPSPGLHFPRPSGRRELLHGGCAAKTYFADGGRDPETGLDYVEEAFWEPGPSWYGRPGKIDHNSFLHRRECLRTCGPWPQHADGTFEFWGEDLSHAVGDAAFLSILGRTHPFYGVDSWVVTKRYHGLSDGVTASEVRE